ncbi:hypothetical protein ACH4UM_38285 [Streptomyces sp. NPDC020801]|uniref:hypothetical protein n=1 Tax=unclassified Streptomyces TaxID=2593676 RepID=UPI00379513BC
MFGRAAVGGVQVLRESRDLMVGGQPARHTGLRRGQGRNVVNVVTGLRLSFRRADVRRFLNGASSAAAAADLVRAPSRKYAHFSRTPPLGSRPDFHPPTVDGLRFKACAS